MQLETRYLLYADVWTYQNELSDFLGRSVFIDELASRNRVALHGEVRSVLHRRLTDAQVPRL